MNNPQVVWCNRTDCFYCEKNGNQSYCEKYNITINNEGCSSYSNGRMEKRYNRGTKEEIYKRNKEKAWDDFCDAMH